jgi:hypothetical protein
MPDRILRMIQSLGHGVVPEDDDMKKPCFFVIATLSLSAAIASSALADLPVSSLTVQNVGANPFPGFPNTGGTGSIITAGPGSAILEKTFTSLGDVPIILHSSPSIGVDFLHISEDVLNNTGVAWTDFHMTMTPIDANPALKVEFLNVTNATGEWTSIQPGTNSLSLFGFVANNDFFHLAFDLKVTSVEGSFDLFGIHEFPSVPSPSASVLAMLGCSILGAISRPRRRREAVRVN